MVKIKYHSNECKYRIIECQYCKKNIKQCDSERHEKTECEQDVECQKCFSVMKRGYFWSYHYSENNDNIECLKAYIKKLENDSKKDKDNFKIKEETYKKEIVKYKNTIKNLEEKNKYYENENTKLKKELEEWNTSLKDIYNKLVLKKEKNKIERENYTLKKNSNYSTNSYRDNINYSLKSNLFK